MKQLIVIIILCTAIVPTFSAYAQNTAAYETAEVCTFGIVPQYSKKRTYDKWAPLLAEISIDTHCEFRIENVADIQTFEKKLMNAEFDFAYTTPYQAYLANHYEEYFPILHSSTQKLQGIIVTRKDSDILRLEELENKVIAFPSPSSLAASRILQSDLQKKGIKYDAIYTKNHTSVYINVAKGFASAGGGTVETFNNLPKNIKNKLRILTHAKPMMPHIVLVHPRISEHLRTLFTKSFIKHSSHNGPIASPVQLDTSFSQELKKFGAEERS